MMTTSHISSVPLTVGTEDDTRPKVSAGQALTKDAVSTDERTEIDKILHEDPFQSPESRKLFEAIDELRSCGANRHIELPEVSQYMCVFDTKGTNLLACNRWRPVCRKVFSASKLDKHSISNC